MTTTLVLLAVVLGLLLVLEILNALFDAIREGLAADMARKEPVPPWLLPPLLLLPKPLPPPPMPLRLLLPTQPRLPLTLLPRPLRALPPPTKPSSLRLELAGFATCRLPCKAPPQGRGFFVLGRALFLEPRLEVAHGLRAAGGRWGTALLQGRQFPTACSGTFHAR